MRTFASRPCLHGRRPSGPVSRRQAALVVLDDVLDRGSLDRWDRSGVRASAEGRGPRASPHPGPYSVATPLLRWSVIVPFRTYTVPRSAHHDCEIVRNTPPGSMVTIRIRKLAPFPAPLWISGAELSTVASRFSLRRLCVSAGPIGSPAHQTDGNREAGACPRPLIGM